MVQPPSVAAFRLLLDAVDRGCLTESVPRSAGTAGDRVVAALFPAPGMKALPDDPDPFAKHVDKVLAAGPHRGLDGDRRLTDAQKRAVAACLLRPRLHSRGRSRRPPPYNAQ